MLTKASVGLSVVALISLVASLLVLTSVMAAGKVRQTYEATILTCIGVRASLIKLSLFFEYIVLAVVTSFFSVVLGAAIAFSLLHFRLKLETDNLLGFAIAVVLGVSVVSLGTSAAWWLKRLKVKPATLLRSMN